jgi:hypothetical protein
VTFLLVVLVLGTSLTIAATGTVSIGLVATITLAWSGVVLIQLLAALAVVGLAPRRRLPLGQATAAFFRLHLPWSAWLLAWALFTWITAPAGRHSTFIMWTALVPACWSAVLIYRFCREVLADAHRAAIVRTCAHQAIIWTSFVVIGGAAVGLWPRVLWVLTR